MTSATSATGQPQNGQSAKAPKAVRKVLRACVVQGGKVVDERRLPDRATLSVGVHDSNTFVLQADGLPKSHVLFQIKGGAYELVLTAHMGGRVSVDDASEPVDIATLKSQGLVQKRGSYFVLPLTDKHRGKVVIGDSTVIFQFVTPPPEIAAPKLPESARGGFLQAIDWVFAAILLTVASIELGVIISMYFVELPKEVTLDTMNDRWAELIAPGKPKDVPPPPAAKTAKPEEKGEAPKEEVAKAEEEEKKPEPEAEKEQTPSAKEQRKNEVREKIRSTGLLAILGAAGAPGASGAVADVFAAGGLNSNLDSAFEGISGVGVATEANKRGGGTGASAKIGGLATSGGGQVNLAAKSEARVSSMKTEAPEVDGALDPAAVAEVVRTRKRMVQDCYEQELKRNPGLSGKIEIEFTIGVNGQVEEAFVSKNQMGSDAVGACIVGRIRKWRFPKPDGGSVTVNFPFIFTSSG